MIYISFTFNILLSTAVEQVAACALVTQRARVRSPVGTNFLGEDFFGVFSSPVRQMSGNFRPTRSPFGRRNHHSIFALLANEWVCAWCVLSFMFVLSRRWPRHRADHSSGEALHVLMWSKKSKFLKLPTIDFIEAAVSVYYEK